MKKSLIAVVASLQLLVSCVVHAETAEPAPQPETGLIGYWKLDEENGKLVKDSSISQADCVIKGVTPPPQVAGRFGRALMFYGKDDGYLTSLASAKLNISGAFTISFWLSPSSGWADQYCSIVSKKSSKRGYVVCKHVNGQSKIDLGVVGTDGEYDLTSASDVDHDVWQHWAVTYNPKTKNAAWYKNGKLDKAYSSIRIGDMSNDAGFDIGHDQAGSPWCFYSGMLIELKIFNRALSADEVKAEYDSHSSIVENPPPLAPLPVAWRVVTTKYPTADVVIAGCTVLESTRPIAGIFDCLPVMGHDRLGVSLNIVYGLRAISQIHGHLMDSGEHSDQENVNNSLPGTRDLLQISHGGWNLGTESRVHGK